MIFIQRADRVINKNIFQIVKLICGTSSFAIFYDIQFSYDLSD